MLVQKPELFRKESARRFGNLGNYVAEKLEDGFPISGNMVVAGYIRHYLEFLFKRNFIKNHLTQQEREFLDGSQSSTAEYLKSPSLDFDYLKQASISAFFMEKGREEIAKKMLELEARLSEERKIFPIRQRLFQARQGFFEAIPEIRLMDVGPAIGAVSTMFALKVLDEYGLAGRTRIYLVDISDKVLERNKKGEFDYPEELICGYFGSQEYFQRMRSYLGGATLLQNSADQHIELPDDLIDISLACFLFHHIANEAKASAGREITRVTRGGIFVADEYFDDYEQEFAARHRDDMVSLAPEEPVQFEESIISILPDTIFREGDNFREQGFYTYWALKNPPNFYGDLQKGI